MRSMSEIKRNLRAVRETRQITNAMYLLSASITKRALARVSYNQIYLQRIRAVVKDLLGKSAGVHHVYLDERQEKKATFIVISSDKRLCGAYNHNVVARAEQALAKYDDPYIISVGLCGSEIMRSRDLNIGYEWLGVSQEPSLFFARKIGENLVDLYNRGDTNEVYVVYTRYYSQSEQKAECVRVLPLEIRDFEDVCEEFIYEADMLYEPCIADVFDTMVPQYIIGFIYGCLNESLTSENIARMNAMQNATRNADDMIKKLGFAYNTARQLAITSELTELAAATEIIDSAV
jgi:F-type H+-transporting ATPase subunit gamma